MTVTEITAKRNKVIEHKDAKVRDTIIAIRKRMRGEMDGHKEVNSSHDDVKAAAERYEAWKVREIARIKKERFNSAVASVIRELLDELKLALAEDGPTIDHPRARKDKKCGLSAP